MKVLHLSSEKSWRGGEQQIAYLIEALEKLGVDSIAAVRKDSAFEQWCRENGVPFFALDFKNDFDLFSANYLRNHCAKEAIDLIHLHSSRGHGIAVLAALLGNKTPLVLSRRVDFELKTNLFSKWKYNHPAIKKIICVSDKIRAIVSRVVKDPGRCVTVYDGIDLERFRGKGEHGIVRNALGILPEVKLIGNIAAIAPHKDYFTFLDTVNLLKTRVDAKFVICGDGPLREQIENKIDDLNLRNEVFVLGFRKDLENVFADLDVLLYTSKEEGLGSTLLDAMAYGLPVVATEAGGIPEIVKNEFNGLTAPVQDPENLSRQVLRILNDNTLRDRLIQNAANFVKDYSKDVMALKTLEIYQEVLTL